ncbi:E3 ubiquitin-protein ligase synoviolin-like [Homarus americanus]|uniref:E3 ubiquitin-protein ligase synoviolin-like n=1 Tax=Homarus americanus TaxID=6706 RepID=UPI001C45EC08|nr:E3 ubiquitin-protein ligase synoviolin-like [Homarus americanus]
MTEDEVRQLEGNERQHVEARIQVLRNIQTLLDAAVVQMNQYASIVASLDTNNQTNTRTSQQDSDPATAASDSTVIPQQPAKSTDGSEAHQIATSTHIPFEEKHTTSASSEDLPVTNFEKGRTDVAAM